MNECFVTSLVKFYGQTMTDAPGEQLKSGVRTKKNVPSLDRTDCTYPVIKTVVLRGEDMVRLSNILVAE